jgi:4-amino-4-deoxy-L-arabinose transferase-like glycosyltransferase
VSSGMGGPGGGGSRPGGAPPSGAMRPSGAGGPMGGGGSLSTEAVAYLKAHMGSATYLLAATGSQTTSSIIIDTGLPVVTIGGFSGQDDAPTVGRLAQMVRDGQLKYVLVSDGGGGRGGSSELTSWVTSHGTEVTGVTVSSGTLYQVTA